MAEVSCLLGLEENGATLDRDAQPKPRNSLVSFSNVKFELLSGYPHADTQ